MNDNSPNGLIEHFFRHQSGKLCARLTRIFGIQNIDLVEDMVQAALLTATETWKTKGIPENPEAWIHRVARNKVIDFLRKDARKKALDSTELESPNSDPQDELLDFDNPSLFEDDMLRMIFACCNPVLPSSACIPLTLKLVGGFSEKEIAAALLMAPDAVRKRIYRAKKVLAEDENALDLPDISLLADRLQTVHHILYLIFNQGYSPTEGDKAVREDLCEEATRLCFLLCKNTVFATPASKALLALMLFQASRMDCRVDSDGEMIMLEQQDRRSWDQVLIRRGLHYLNESETENLSTYHIEAQIAMLHSIAKDFESTDWIQIEACYDWLHKATNNPIYLVNKAIAMGFGNRSENQGSTKSLELLNSLKSEKELERYPWLDAAIGTFYQKDKNYQRAMECFESAKKKTNLPSDKRLLDRKIEVARSFLK